MRDQPGSASESFEAFVVQRGPALLRTAFLLTGDHGRAEDLVQTALGKSWSKWSSIHEVPREAYVRKVMVNTYIAWWRRRWNGEYPTDALPERPARFEDLDLRRDLLIALAGLPKGQRAVVVLRFFDDLTEAQAAELMGCSVGTVKSQASRALKALRTCPALAATEGELR
ncbi:MAG TPA: SigE family RNA polymerase sigma factor [Ornithinibacter sp.]|nr:SigE family RNA polymerase sigma factor [Ornithinibacter sp.]